jgi:hypothetical protein
MSERGLFGVLRSIVLVGARRPWLAIGIATFLSIVAATLVPGLKISTSRRDLVSADHPSQARIVAFHDKFGYPDTPAMVVSGGSADERRKAVDSIEAELRALPELQDRVLGRTGPEDVAEVLLLHRPEMVSKGAPAGAGKSAELVEKGLVGWLELLDTQLKTGLDEGTATPEDSKAGLEGLARLARAMDDELAGADASARFSDLAKDESGKTAFHSGMDEHGYLAGAGEHHVIAMFPALEGDEGYQVQPLIEKIRGARDVAMKKQEGSAVRADVTGLPALVADELTMVERDLATTSGAATILIVLTLWFGFRSFRLSMVSFLPLSLGTLVTFAVVRLTLGKLNLITASFTSVLLGLGDFGVHIQNRYSEMLRSGKPPQVAMEAALMRAGPGLAIGTVTTAFAFLTTMASEFTAFAELGYITCLGLVIMLAGTYLLVPSVILLFFKKKPSETPEVPGFRRLAGFVRSSPKLIVIVACVLTAGFALGLPGVHFRGRYFDFLPRSTESARGLAELEKDPLLNPFVANVRATSVEEARRTADALRALPSVASVETATDLLPPLDDARLADVKKVSAALSRADGTSIDFAKAKGAAVNGDEVQKQLGSIIDTLEEVAFKLRSSDRDAAPADDAKAAMAALKKRIAELPDGGGPQLTKMQTSACEILERASRSIRGIAERGSYLPTDLPPLFQHRFVSKDKTELALFVHPKGDIWEPAVADVFAREVSAVAPEASGIAMTIDEHPKLIVRGFQRSSLLAAVFVIVILGVSFRRGFDVAVACAPLAMGAVWMLGSMQPLGLTFNHANMVVLPLLLGLGVEASAHIVQRYRESARIHDGVADLDEVLAGTGSAVFIAAMTTVFGFSVMMFANYRAMFSLGLIMTIGMTATLALSLVVLPALLFLLKRAK